jgi:hypothetical protein
VSATENKVCEDCGEDAKRRTRAKCGALVCSFCLHHVHGWQCGGSARKKRGATTRGSGT